MKVENFENFAISLIYAFEYDSRQFSSLEEKLGIVLEKVREPLAVERKLTEDWWGQKGGSQNQIYVRNVKCFEFPRNVLCKKFGLCQNNNPVYRFEKKCTDVFFRIDHVRTYFNDSGRAFLIFHILPKEKLEDVKMLEFRKALTEFNINRKIEYSYNISKDESEKNSFSLCSLRNEICETLKQLSDMNISYDKQRAWQHISYRIVDYKTYNMDKVQYLLENIRGNRVLSNEPIKEKYCYINQIEDSGPIYRVVEPNGLFFLGDRNKQFIRVDLYVNVYSFYLLLYLYYLDVKMNCEEVENFNREIENSGGNYTGLVNKGWRLPRRIENMCSDEPKYEHIPKLFREYLCRTVWNLTEERLNNNIDLYRKSEQKFALEELKRKIRASKSIRDCEKVPLSRDINQKNYIFISYAHKDYKSVYLDLVDLREARVNFWYDEGLSPGRNWEEEVKQRITDPRCKGVIFYMSKNLFFSKNAGIEMKITYDHHQQSKFFSVNIEDGKLPIQILKTMFQSKKFDGSDIKMEDVAVIANVFRDPDTFIEFDKEKQSHKERLLEAIKNQFPEVVKIEKGGSV